MTRSPAKTASTGARAEPLSKKKAAAKLPAKSPTAKKSPAPAPKASALPPEKRAKPPSKRAPAAPPASNVTSAKAARSAVAAEKPVLNSMLKTPLQAVVKESASTPAAASVAVAAQVPIVPTKAPRAKSAAKSRYGAPMPAAPLPPPTSRFADRFAPPRPPTRQMNNLGVDTPKVAPKADPKLANAWKSKAGKDLTEAEILAMPDSEYMNDKQLEFFRATLKKLKDDLLSNAGETTEHLREDTSIVPDPADRATIEEEHALELRTRDRERKLLKKIAQSLNRVESGEYGFCDETGEPIGLGRLIARPTATLSLEAQQRRELKHKMFGD